MSMVKDDFRGQGAANLRHESHVDESNLSVPASGGYADPAKLEDEWLSSETEHRLAVQRKVGTVVCVVSGILGVLFFVSWLVLRMAGKVGTNSTLVIVAGVLIYISAGGYLVRINYDKTRRRFIEREMYVYRALSIRRAAAKVEDALSLANLYVFNRTLMTDYHSITKGQSEKSFRYSQMASFVGLAVLVSGAVVTVMSTPTLTKIAVASLAGLGAGVSGYISKTFLRSHELAISQLNNFFRQPLVSNYLLMAERLANGLSGEVKSEAHLEIIRKIIESAQLAEGQSLDSGKSAKSRSLSGVKTSKISNRRSSETGKEDGRQVAASA
ncbi:TRADD-N-associated membrane domain-containing protein [Amycolatopsis japonica]|uniref:TRADD-N-associated membrane domain-containing protein n=1 Tax=Amycolatopsis japonica TaxID=208439 RepID=UPI0037F47988